MDSQMVPRGSRFGATYFFECFVKMTNRYLHIMLCHPVYKQNFLYEESMGNSDKDKQSFVQAAIAGHK